MSHQEGLLKAIRHFGTQQALGKIINVSQQRINYWLNNATSIPYKYVLKIEAASNGAINRHELAPEQNDINMIIDIIINQTLQIHIKRIHEEKSI